ncbi:unnamed protein product [Closterium sp. Yama58-4]|nr:unnamed protein product [Closterium sp. Yama58-4]
MRAGEVMGAGEWVGRPGGDWGAAHRDPRAASSLAARLVPNERVSSIGARFLQLFSHRQQQVGFRIMHVGTPGRGAVQEGQGGDWDEAGEAGDEGEEEGREREEGEVTDAMLRAQFCFAPTPPTGYSDTVVRAVLLGCIPVIVQPNTQHPFASASAAGIGMDKTAGGGGGGAIHWPSLALFLAPQQLPELPEILRGITAEENSYFILKDNPIPHTCISSSLPFHRHRGTAKQSVLSWAIEHIRDEWPYWDRHAGADHVFLANDDWAACEVGEAGRRDPMLARSTVLSLWGYSGNMPFDAALPGCFIPGQDVVIPPVLLPEVYEAAMGVQGEYGQAGGRDIFFFFRGFDGRDVEPVLGFNYSFGVRQALFDWFDSLDSAAAVPKGFVIERTPGEGDFGEQQGGVGGERGERGGYLERMARSVFCLVAGGWGADETATQAVTLGCIPVIIQPNVSMPFEGDGFLDWDDFSVRLTPADIPHLHGILTSIPPQELALKQAALRRVWVHFAWASLQYNPFSRILDKEQGELARDVASSGAFRSVMRALAQRKQSLKGDTRSVGEGMASGGGGGVAVTDPRSGGEQRDDERMERHDEAFHADVEEADDDGVMDHLSDPGVYFQQETANDVALSQAMRWCNPDDDVANKSNYSHTTPVSPIAGDLDGSPEEGRGDAEMACEEAEKRASLSDASVENVALWSRSRTTMEHDDYDRIFDAHGGLQPNGDRGKMLEGGDGGDEGGERGKFEEGRDVDRFGADGDYYNDDDDDNRHANDDVMGFQFWRTSLPQDGSADGQHADDAESAHAAEYGTMWHNMTGHLENMKDDWAEAQAVAEGEAGSGGEAEEDDDTRSQASAHSDTALLLDHLQLGVSGPLSVLPWDEEAEEEAAQEAARDAREEIRAARAEMYFSPEAEEAEAPRGGEEPFSLGPSAADARGADGLPQRDASAIPPADDVGAGDSAASEGATSDQAGRTEPRSDMLLPRIRTTGDLLLPCPPTGASSPVGAAAAGADAVAADARSMPELGDVQLSAVEGSAGAGTIGSGEGIGGASAGKAAGAAGGEAKEAGKAGEMTALWLAGMPRVEAWVRCLPRGQWEPSESIEHWSSIGSSKGGGGGSSSASAQVPPHSPPAPHHHHHHSSSGMSKRSMSHGHMHGGGAAAAGNLQAAVAVGAAAAAEHAGRVVRGLDKHAAAVYLSMRGLLVVPPLGAFSSLKTLDLSRNNITSVATGVLPRSLHILDLSHNRLAAVEGLRELSRLKVLNLSNNRLARIGHGLSGCVALRELYLAGNRVGEVEGLHRLLKLTVLDLGANKVTTTKALGQLAANYASLRALNLAGNPIHVNLGDDAFKRYLIGLLPQLLYLNQRPIKTPSSRDALSDPLKARGAGAPQLHHGHSSRSASRTAGGSTSRHRTGGSSSSGLRKAATGGTSGSGSGGGSKDGHHRTHHGSSSGAHHSSRSRTATGGHSTHRSRSGVASGSSAGVGENSPAHRRSLCSSQMGPSSSQRDSTSEVSIVVPLLTNENDAVKTAANGGADPRPDGYLPLLEPSPSRGSPGSDVVLPLGPCRRPLPRWQVVAYGTGHMLNDITAACWFTYLLIYLSDIGLSPQQAGVVMLSGQFADAAATLVAGELIDRFGHYKLWHFGGSVCTVVSFSSVFGGCLVCHLLASNSTLVETASYSVFAAVFNCGWAATQVSHMAMVNCLTANPSSRVAMNSCRNAFTMVANLALFAIALAAFSLFPAHDPSQVQAQYRWISFVALTSGAAFLLVFYAGVQEPTVSRAPVRLPSSRSFSTNQSADDSTDQSQQWAVKNGQSDVAEEPAVPAWLFWFRQLAYFQVAAVYMFVRLITNVSQAMLPFFLIFDLGLHPSAKATIPALIFICSFITSVVLQELQWDMGRMRVACSMGAVLWVGASAAFLYVDAGPSMELIVYALALVVGISNALMLVTATSLEGVLVGQHVSVCAFVYGSLSFLDKFTCGIALVAIQAFNTKEEYCGPTSPTCPRSIVRWVLFLLPLVSSLLAGGIVLTTHLDESSDEITQPSLDSPLLDNKNSASRTDS